MSDDERMEVEEQAGEGEEGTTTKAKGSKSGKRFEIKKWNAVAMWSWAICTDTCAICRNNLYEPSIEYQANPTGDADHPGLSIAWGNCGHVFHLDCIQRWLKTRGTCPLCAKDWEFSKVRRQPVWHNRTLRIPKSYSRHNIYEHSMDWQSQRHTGRCDWGPPPGFVYRRFVGLGPQGTVHVQLDST